ncbi:MAG: helix-turn-helix domain-containing protein [Muribaculaceae bacterium]|nr:helix-turn-helix domain-containing protein [Muribaculaceae bacterium]
MSKIDIVRLRKSEGISQKRLASMLEIKPSFLSAIENGRSRMPEDKVEKLRSIFGDDEIDGYIIDTPQEPYIPPHTHIHDEGDSLTQLLNHFHDLAHKKNHESRDREIELLRRLDNLSLRNERMSERIDELRNEVDLLRTENFRIKELLIANGISYSDISQKE